MEDYFIGRIGKDFGFTLISTTPFIVHVHCEGVFHQYATLSEALNHLDSAVHTVYVFDDRSGAWMEVNFASDGIGSSKKSVGFVPH